MKNEEIIKYYQEHYNGLTRKELFKKDRSFYEELKKRGLIDIVPRKRREPRNWSSMSNEEVIEYYKKYYNGLSRGELFKKDPGFYNELRKRRLIDIVHVKRYCIAQNIKTLENYFDFAYENSSRTLRRY